MIDGWTHTSIALPEKSKEVALKALIVANGHLQEDGTWKIVSDWQGTVYEWKLKEEQPKEEVKSENTELSGNQ